MAWQRIRVREWGDPDVMRIERIEALPQPAPGEALVRVEAAGVGYTDTIVRRGRYIDYKGGLPMTPGYDLAGQVAALGAGVSGPLLGTMVCDMPMHGSYSEYVVRPASDLVAVPAGLDPADAVQVPLIYMTAYQMLTREVTLAQGDAILVVGASGSVGRALVRLGVHRGLRVIGTASARNLDAVQRLGAIPIDHQRPDLVAAVRDASRGGVMAAFDAIGGLSWRRSWRSLTRRGTLVGYGLQDFLDSDAGLLSALLSFARLKLVYPVRSALDGSGRRTTFYNILHRRRARPEDYRADAAVLLDMLASGAIRSDPVETLPLAAAPAAHRRIADGGLAVRLILHPGD